MKAEGEVHEGKSRESFEGAATNAVREYELRHGVPNDLVTFKVEEMYVRARHNPIHEYIVYVRRVDG